MLEDSEKTENIGGHNAFKGRREAQLFHLYDIDVDIDVGNNTDDDNSIIPKGRGSEMMNVVNETEPFSTPMSFVSMKGKRLSDPIHNHIEDGQTNTSFILDTTLERYPKETRYHEKITDRSERDDYIAQKEKEGILED